MKSTVMTTRARRSFRYRPALEMSPCGRWLLTWSDHGARAFDAAEPGPPLWQTEEEVQGLCVAQELVIYITRKPNRVVVARLADGVEVGSCALPGSPLAVVADVGRQQVFVAAQDGALRRYKLSSAGLAEDGALPGEPCQSAYLALAPDGSFLAAAFSPRDARSVPVLRVDPVSLVVTHVHKGLRSTACGVHICPDSAVIVASTSSSALLWAGPNGKAQNIFKAKSYLAVVGFAGPHHLLMTDHNAQLVCYHLPSGTIIWSHESYGPAAVVGDQVVHARFHQVMLRDVGTGALVRQCSVGDYPEVLAADRARGLAHLCGSGGSLIRTWRLDEAGFEAREESCGDKVDCLASSEDGALLALGTAEGAVMLYALDDPGQLVRVFAPAYNRYGCNALHIDVAGDKLWAACGGRIVRWRLSTGEQEACSEHQKNELYAMLILPERGEIVAAARATRRTYGELVVLDLETLNTLHAERLTETVVGITRRGTDEVMLRGGYTTRGFDVVRRVFTTYDVNQARGASIADAAPVAVRAMSRFNKERDDYDNWLERVTLEEDPQPIGERVSCTAAVAGQPLWLDVESGSVIALLYDRTVRIWNMKTGEQIACLHVHIGSPNDLLQVPGQDRFVACGVDGSVELISIK